MQTLVIATLLLSTPAAPPPADPMAPSGKWTVEYGDSECVLSRNYGALPALTIIGFKPAALGGSLQILVLSPGARKEWDSGKAVLTLEPSKRSIESSYDAYGFKRTNQTLTTISTDEDVSEELNRATSVRIDFAKGQSQVVSVPGIKAALAALQTCQTDLLKSWNVDPTERERWAKPDKGLQTLGNMANWITSDNYPGSALSAGHQGAAMALWKIGKDGRVSDCRIVKSSGFPELDKATCTAITTNARYRPAVDKQGEPMELHSMRRVIWRLP